MEARRKGWLPVYVGRNTQRLLDFAGGEGLGCPGRINAKDNAAREATCQLCAQLEREPLTFAWTEAEGVEILDHMLTRTARRNRDKALDRCAEKMAEGCNLLILCHCRWWREESGPGRRCHGDGIARELERRANAIIGAQPDEPAGFAFRLSDPRDGTAQPLGPGPPQKSPTPPPPPQPTTTHQPPPARPTRPQMGAGEAALGQDARTAARRMADTTEALAAASTTTETQPTPSLENNMTRDLEGRSRAAANTGGDDGRPVAEAATACSSGGGGDGLISGEGTDEAYWQIDEGFDVGEARYDGVAVTSALAETARSRCEPDRQSSADAGVGLGTGEGGAAAPSVGGAENDGDVEQSIEAAAATRKRPRPDEGGEQQQPQRARGERNKKRRYKSRAGRGGDMRNYNADHAG